MKMCALADCKLHSSTGKRKREGFLGAGLRSIWQVYREEVTLEGRLKLQAEQKPGTPIETKDSLAKSGFWLQMLKDKAPHSTFWRSSVTRLWDSVHVLIIAPFFSFHNCTAKQLEFHKLLIRAADQLYLAGLAISIVVIILSLWDKALITAISTFVFPFSAHFSKIIRSKSS